MRNKANKIPEFLGLVLIVRLDLKYSAYTTEVVELLQKLHSLFGWAGMIRSERTSHLISIALRIPLYEILELWEICSEECTSSSLLLPHAMENNMNVWLCVGVIALPTVILHVTPFCHSHRLTLIATFSLSGVVSPSQIPCSDARFGYTTGQARTQCLDEVPR